MSYLFDANGNLGLITNSSASAPILLAHPHSAVAPTSANAAFSVSVIGSPPLAYQWQLNSNNIPNATTDALLLTNISPADFGAYRVIVSNPSGSVTSSNALLQLDSDRDGMADAWETNYFGSITNRDGFQDYDGDGVSDRDEFLEGTDPKNFSSANPRLTLYSDNGEVFVTPNVPLFTNGQTITLTGVPDPGLQFLGYLGQPSSGGPFYNLRTNPAPLRFGAPGVNGSQIVRAIFGLPLSFALDVTNGWRIDQAGWFGQTNVTHDGVAAAQSARLLGAGEALLELTNVVLSTAGTISFWWKVDGTDRDFLQFRRNNLLRSGAIGTNTDWQLRTYYLPAGVNVVRWEYVKGSDQVSEYNGLYYAPADAGWVDEVSYAAWPDPLLDSDGDGLPDIWEYKYFDTLAYGPNDDPDNDGISNRDEYLDGTDPSSNASLLPRLTVLASGGTVARNPDLPKYNLGQIVQLQAVPDPTNYFVIWTGPVSGTNSTNSILMNGNKTVTATFGLPLPVALDTPTLPWTRAGVIGFFGQTNVSHDGLHSAQSGPVGFHQETAMETSVTGPGTLVFWWKVSCDTNYNFGRFLIDGVEQPEKITGETPWQPQSYYLPGGSHALRWNYTNNLSVVSLTDGIWVDQVKYTAGITVPEILVQPTNLVVLQGSNAVLNVVAAATPPTTYQWYFKGASLGAAGASPTLTLSSVSSANAGDYYATINNSAGNTNTATVTLTVLPVPPTNDNFANRILIPDANAVTGYNYGATTEAGEPNHGGGFASGSVWWKWIAPVTGRARLIAESQGSSSSLIAAVYSGSSLANLSPVASLSQNPAFTNGQYVADLELTFDTTANTEYAVALAHQFNPGAYLTVQLQTLAVPPNDSFANRIVLTGPSTTAVGSNNNATYETGEPLAGVGSGSVWWSWTAPRTGQAVATASGFNFTPVMRIFTGSSVNTLTTVAIGLPGSTVGETRAGFSAQAGVPYQISLDSAAGVSGSVQINVAMSAPDFVSAGFNPGGLFAFSFAAPAGAHYEIQGSDDLLHWTTLDSGAVPANGIVAFTDTTNNPPSLRFYRVVLTP